MNTAVPALFRRVPGLPPIERERVELPDGDFLDLDWLRRPDSDRLMLALPGMGGFARRPYVRGMMKHFHKNGWNAVGLNYRGASGEPNRFLKSYHMGSTEDVQSILEHLTREGRYSFICLVGFSLGGNLVLKYFGEQRTDIPEAVKTGVAFAVPSDIAATNRQLNRGLNKLYVWHFIDLLYRKLRKKRKLFSDFRPPWLMPFGFHDYDSRFTGPIHGFEGADDYWESTRASNFLPHIDRPVLQINSRDDSFLPEVAYPVETARASTHFHLQLTDYGGHCGFVTHSLNTDKPYWSEARALEWAEQILADQTTPTAG